jgi:hypothetical protein
LGVVQRLQRLCVSGFGDRDVSDVGAFTLWLSSVASLQPGGTLPLTHLCLVPAVPINDEDRDAVITLLPLLPALEALVLECMQHLRPADVARLALACPRGLRALTLTLKPSYFHLRAVPCIWPGGGFEYAAALAPLVNLRVFRWNPYIRPRDPAPGWDLVHFEEAYDDAPPQPSTFSFDPDPWAEEWEDYGEHCMNADARMFAALLPALEHLIWIAGEKRYGVGNISCITRVDRHSQVTTYTTHSLGRPSEVDFIHAYPEVSLGVCWPLPGSREPRYAIWSLEEQFN